MKTLSQEVENHQLTDSASSLHFNPSTQRRKIIHVLVGNKSILDFGRHELPSSLSRSALKRVSRHHCRISWNLQTEGYDLKVTGTNGIKYAGKFYGPGEHLNISSNSVIDFVGLKVLFLDSEPWIPKTNAQVASLPKNGLDDQWAALPQTPLTSQTSDGILGFPKTFLEGSARNSFLTYNGSYGSPKSNKLVGYEKSLDLKDPIATIDGNFVKVDDFADENAVSSIKQALYDNLIPCAETKKDIAIKKRKQHWMHEADSIPSISTCTPEKAQISLAEDSCSLEETKQKSNQVSSGGSIEAMVTGESTSNIKLLAQNTTQPEDEDFINLVLQTLVSMGKRTPVSLKSLLEELLRIQPNLDLTPALLTSRLSQLPMFVRVPALGPSPELQNDQYYYSPELDWNPSRKTELGTLVRKPRGCTLASKRYYFKPLPKPSKYKGPSSKKQ